MLLITYLPEIPVCLLPQIHGAYCPLYLRILSITKDYLSFRIIDISNTIRRMNGRFNNN